ncbi:MAG: hypothetical protein IT162_18265 [Bryobacterales bacterium]|nr:hypothetical protein [Bryobacterales bacterium]
MTNDGVAGLLDRAVALLTMPTLDNLRQVEELLRESVVCMPEEVTDEIRDKVRLCGRLVESAEAMRPSGGAAPATYSPFGAPPAAASTSTRITLEI